MGNASLEYLRAIRWVRLQVVRQKVYRQRPRAILTQNTLNFDGPQCSGALSLADCMGVDLFHLVQHTIQRGLSGGGSIGIEAGDFTLKPAIGKGRRSGQQVNNSVGLASAAGGVGP